MEFEEYLQKKQFAPKTIQSYLKSLDKVLQWLQKENITVEEARYSDMLAYIKYATNLGYSKRYINMILGIVRHYYNYLIKEKRVTDNIAANLYVQGVSRRLPHDILSETDLLAIYEKYPVTTMSQKRNKAIIGLLIFQGLSTGELYKIEAEHVNLKEGTIFISGSRKSNNRTIPLLATQILELHEYIHKIHPICLEYYEKNTKALFVSMSIKDSTSNIMTSIFKSIKKHCGYSLTTNQIRSSVITHWLTKYNLREVQYMSGHRYVSSTERYQLSTLDDLQNELNEFFPS